MRSLLLSILMLVACGGGRPTSKPVVNEARSDAAVATVDVDAGAAAKPCVWIDVFEILDRVYFDAASAKLRKASKPIVDAIADTIKANPRIEKLGVVGARGPGEPDSLSLDRAKTVIAALVARGVPASQLEAHGHLNGLAIEADQRAVWFVTLRVDGKDARPLTGDARWIPWRRDCEASEKAHRDEGAPLDCDCVKPEDRQ
jgi:hypothetical protein